MKEVERLLQRFDGGRVLDVATQHGRFVEVLIDNLKSYAAIVGIDLERRFIQTARDSISGANVSFQVMDAEDLEFEDESFDTVTISASLHHMGDAERVLSEMKRVLKPGGRLLVVEMHGDAETEPERTSARIHEWAAEIDRALGRLHNGVFTRAEIVSLFAKLDMRSTQFLEGRETDSDSDPMDKGRVAKLKEVVGLLAERAAASSGGDGLTERGHELTARLSEVGAHAEPILILTGEK